MTFEQFNKLLSLQMAGDSKACNDKDLVKLLIDSAFKKVCVECNPIVLVESDLTKDVFKWIDDNTFIRKWSLPVNDADIVDIDDDLAEAVLFYVCAEIVKNEPDMNRTKFYDSKAKQIITNYWWKLYQFENGGCDVVKCS
jgi:hypothetical protein